jgi:hypothetical protein
MRIISVYAIFLVSILISGCNSTISPAVTTPAASPPITRSLPYYDHYRAQFLDQATSHPTKNLGGDVVWNTRYYLESLITAYQATANPKYLAAFEETGTTVLNLVQTLQVPGGADPSAPGKLVPESIIQTTGWPTYMATFSEPISVPTADGRVSFYAQSFYPRNASLSNSPVGANFIDITQQSDGTLQFSWCAARTPVQTFTLASVNDFSKITSQPLVYGRSFGRITPTGAGLPAPGRYAVGIPLVTIWHLQTGGTLLPFVRFLLIAKEHPGTVNPKLVSAWRSKVLQLASDYVDQFDDDGNGGYTFRNPVWMPSTEAGLNSNSDYVFAEVSFRILLFELTGDSTHLVYARGLLRHQLINDIPIGPNGWLMVREWPDVQPWSDKSQAPPGVIWDSLSFDPTAPENATEGFAFAQMLDLASTYHLTETLGIPEAVLRGQLATVEQYLSIPQAPTLGISSSVRYAYPWSENDSLANPGGPSSDPFAGAGYLWGQPSEFADANWQWMLLNGTNPHGLPVGYFLRAWAWSEAAEIDSIEDSPAGLNP